LFAVEVLIDDEMFQRAKRKADDLGLLKNSILGGKGNLAGFLGEEMFLKTFPGSFSENTYQHDINYLGTKIEIKTVQTTVFPSLEFNCHVAAYNAKQRADRYVFARVLKSYNLGWLIGWMDVNDFKDLSRKAYKGDRDGDFVFPIDCFNLRYRELEPFYELLETT